VKNFRLTANSIGLFIAELWKLDLTKVYRVTIVQWREKRSNDQNSLYWKWLGEISKQQNVSDDPEIWHEIFKKYYCPEKVINEHVSIKSTKKLDLGEMHFYLNKVERYCMDRGYLITIPDNCEYKQLLDKQEE
jgi:hypothetical protein